MPLSMADTGVPISVRQIHGQDETRRFLENLGFVSGATVTVITQFQGNLIVRIKDSRVAISKAMANKIHVA